MKNKSMGMNIGGHNYIIILEELCAGEQDKVLYGRHLVEDNIILINSKIEKSRQQETLIHEILHSIHYNCGLEHDERTIEAISNGLFQLGIGDYLWKKAQKGY
tara:strand:+ start:522 stop:830 length:309 start_codon:yes stop_codon:yes gene_type:complete